MNQFTVVLLSVLALGITASAQAQTRPAPLWPVPADPSVLTPTSSLGGPITPTQPDFFAGESVAPLPSATLEVTSAKTLGLQPVRRSSRPAAPFVDDPPRPSGGGFINVNTD
jgi:hypothetical protein